MNKNQEMLLRRRIILEQVEQEVEEDNSYYILTSNPTEKIYFDNTPIDNFCTEGDNETSITIDGVSIVKNTIKEIHFGEEYFDVVTIPEYFMYEFIELGSIDIPSFATSIGDGAFASCSGLTSLTIGNSVTSIGDYAFMYCSSLTSLTIGNSVTSIGESAFIYCFALTSIDVGAENTAYSSVNGVLFNKAQTQLIQYPGGKTDTPYSIPNSVDTIGGAAFAYCSGLTTITIPNSVITIGDSAFSNCSGLTTLTIGNSVTSIGESAFRACIGLTSLTIPNSVDTIESRAFRGCSGLTTLTIGNSVTTIGGDAFRDCSGLDSVTIGTADWSVATVGTDAMYGVPNTGAETIIAISQEQGEAFKTKIGDSISNWQIIVS